MNAKFMKLYTSTVIFFLLFIVAFSTVDAAWKQNRNMPADYINRTYLDVYFLPSNPQYGWICGFEGRVLRTTNGGQSWLGLRIVPQNGDNIQLESIHFVNERVGFTSGPSTSTFGEVSYLFKTTNGGATWFDITPRGATTIWGNYFIDENLGFAQGGGCDTPQMFWKTTDGGNTWTFSRYFELESKISDVIVYPDGLGFAAGSGALWFTTDLGNSWAILSRTGNYDWHEEITHVGQTHFLPYSGGCNGTNYEPYGGVAYTNDGGTTWKRFSTAAPMYGSFLHDEKRGWGVGFERTIVYTSDGGNTWVWDNCGIPPGVNLDDIWFIDDTTGWVVGDGVYEYFIPVFPSPEITALTDITVCEGDTVELALIGEYDFFQWSNGATTRTISVTEPGTYYVTVYVDSICYRGASNSITVSYHQREIIGLAVASGHIPCEGTAVEITTSGQFIDYKWGDGSTESSLTVSQSGYYRVEVTDRNGCTYSDSIQVNFFPTPTPEAFLSRKRNICVGDTITLHATPGFSKYFWYKEPDTTYFSTDRSVIVDESGIYYVIVVNEFGCEGVSEVIEVIFRDETDKLDFSFRLNEEFQIEDTPFGRLKCGLLEIRNITQETFLLEDLYMFQNIAFTTPLTQFPINIGPNAIIQLKVCFSPVALGLARDTILIADNCTDKLIKLVANGTLESGKGDSRCDVPLFFSPKEITGRYLYISESYPNPASNSISIDYQYEDVTDITHSITAHISDIYGKILINGSIENIAYVSDEQGILSMGKIMFDTSLLNSGLYLIKISAIGEIRTAKVLISK